MKTYKGSYYEVAEKKNSFKLADRHDTYEAAEAAMFEAKLRQIHNGYTPAEFIITRTDWGKVFADDGDFYSYTETTFRVYP